MKFTLVFVNVLFFVGLDNVIGHPGHSHVAPGYNAKKGEAPYTVSINHNGKHVCGGIILSKRWIVTAAHCVEDEPEVTVLAGVTDLQNLDADHQESAIEKIVLHPGYQKGDPHNIENNIALAKLKKDLDFNKYVNKIDMISGADLQNAINNKAVGQISGWGSEDHEQHSRHLKLAQITLLTHDECIADINEQCHTYDKNSNLCTGPLTGTETGVGHYDDGGPLVINDKLAGVILHGEHAHAEEEECHKSSLYTNIDYFKSFINENLQK